MSLEDLTRQAMDAGRAAYNNDEHPCRPFVDWQLRVNPPPASFQMPEPFSGRSASLRIAIVGANPGFRAEESGFPNPETEFDEYHEFFVSRFDRRFGRDGNFCSGCQRYWYLIEKFFRKTVSEFRLGRHARLMEIVRFKTKGIGRGDGPTDREWDEAIARCERQALIFTMRNIEADIFVTLGERAAKEFYHCIGFDNENNCPNFRASSPDNDFGRLFTANLEANLGRSIVHVIPLIHPNCRVTSGTWHNHESQNRARENLANLLRDRGRF